MYYKIIITGPVGAGKTTAIHALSDIPPVTTDAMPSDHVGNIKNSTTVALDYGVIELGKNQKIHLYGTPGQERFDFMWDIMLDGALGIIFLINNNTPQPLQDLRRFMDSFKDSLQTLPFCIGVTHMDENASPSLNAYQKILQEHNHVVPVFSVDGRSKEDMNTLLMAMLGMIEPTLLAEAI